MIRNPDVLGYILDDALELLEQNDFKVSIKESIGKEKIEQGIKRVISQKKMSDKEIELIISYF